MERLFENIEFYITTSGELRLRVIYVNQDVLNRIEKDIPIAINDMDKTNVVIELANKLLDKEGA
jgi:hypothetical protein